MTYRNVKPKGILSIQSRRTGHVNRQLRKRKIVTWWIDNESAVDSSSSNKWFYVHFSVPQGLDSFLFNLFIDDIDACFLYLQFLKEPDNIKAFKLIEIWANRLLLQWGFSGIEQYYRTEGCDKFLPPRHTYLFQCLINLQFLYT